MKLGKINRSMKALVNLFSKRKGILRPIILLAIFITVVLIIKTPIKQSFEYDPDEGFELMKSLLFLNGFSLYKEISNDQPPLFTLILSYWFKLFGPSVYHARILILIFSCLLLWAFYGIIKDRRGDFCAFIAVIFLLLSAVYLRLSSAIMIGTAAVSLAMVSIYLVSLYRRLHLKCFLLLSGIFIGLSLQTKLFTMFALPLIALEIIQVKKQNRPLAAVFLWFASFLITFLTVTVIFFHFDFHAIIQQLFQPHLNKINILGCDFSLIWKMILTDYDIALLALLGIILLARQRKWESCFPVLCLALILAILLKHRPIWYHYYLPVSIFLSWLAAISFSEFFRVDIRQGWFTRKDNKYSARDIFLRWATAAIIILTILRLPGKYNRMCRSVLGETTPEEHRAVKLLSKYREYTHWIVADRSIFAFYANMLVPPELTLITEKRKFTEGLGQDYLINKLKKYRPEQILLERLKYYGPRVISYIEENYCKVYHGKFSSPVWFLDNNIWIIKRMWIAKRIEFTICMWLANPNWTIIRKCFTDKGWRDRFNAIQEPSYKREIKLYMRNDIAKSLETTTESP